MQQGVWNWKLTNQLPEYIHVYVHTCNISSLVFKLYLTRPIASDASMAKSLEQILDFEFLGWMISKNGKLSVEILRCANLGKK